MAIARQLHKIATLDTNPINTRLKISLQPGKLNFDNAYAAHAAVAANSNAPSMLISNAGKTIQSYL